MKTSLIKFFLIGSVPDEENKKSKMESTVEREQERGKSGEAPSQDVTPQSLSDLKTDIQKRIENYKRVRIGSLKTLEEAKKVLREVYEKVLIAPIKAEFSSYLDFVDEKVSNLYEEAKEEREDVGQKELLLKDFIEGMQKFKMELTQQQQQFPVDKSGDNGFNSQ